MTTRNTLTQLIAKHMICPYPITGESNLYTDLGYDSLSFARLLVCIEETFSIDFDLMQMHSLVCVNALISAVEIKLAQKPENPPKERAEKPDPSMLNEKGRYNA